MTIIVPLAGPDFDLADGGVKPELMVGGVPLLQRCLESRPWSGLAGKRGGGYVFVFKDSKSSRGFAEGPLARWYPHARRIYLSNFTEGAALSALAGAALAQQDQPLVIDLADIEFDAPALNLNRLFSEGVGVGALALTFESQLDCYSYIREEDGLFVEAVEKRVVSNHASAGVYIYRRPATYLGALHGVLAGDTDYRHRGLHYVCPVFNGVKALGLEVLRKPVRLIQDIKTA